MRVLHYPTTELICLCLLTVCLLLPPLPFLLLSRRPHTLQIQSVLLPPLIGRPWALPTLRRQTQFHNGPGSNKLCGCVLAAVDVGLHLLKSCLYHSVLQKGIEPYSAPSSPRLSPRQPTGHPLVESAQNPPNVRCCDPRLQPVKNDHHIAYIGKWILNSRSENETCLLLGKIKTILTVS